jgi:hypothetical protein
MSLTRWTLSFQVYWSLCRVPGWDPLVKTAGSAFWPQLWLTLRTPPDLENLVRAELPAREPQGRDPAWTWQLPGTLPSQGDMARPVRWGEEEVPMGKNSSRPSESGGKTSCYCLLALFLASSFPPLPSPPSLVFLLPARDGTLGLTYARQALCHWSIAQVSPYFYWSLFPFCEFPIPVPCQFVYVSV